MERTPTTKLGLEAYKCLLDDCKINRKEFPLERIHHEGVSFLTVTLPALGRALDRGLKDGRFNLPSSFKHAFGTKKIPQIMGSLFRKIFSETGLLLKDACAFSVSCIRQVCYYFYKANIPCHPEKETQVLDTFIEDEKRLEGFNVFLDVEPLLHNSRIQRIISEGQREIYRLFGHYDRNTKYDLKYTHGPGAVADASIDAKDVCPIPASLEDYWGTCLTGGDENLSQGSRQVAFANDSRFELKSRTSKVTLVPKDSRGPRLIAVEPTWLQYLQQGVRNWIYSTTEEKLHGKFVHFTDQSANRAAALFASHSGNLATLDLKRASDLICLSLVKRLFALVPHLLDDMLNCRSEFYSIDKKITGRYRKFAPMGSALCFPVLALTLYALSWGTWFEDGGSRDSFYVDIVGDDLITPKDFARSIIPVLNEVGLIINEDKSCIGTRFAESCGVDAFDGTDVTPLKVDEVSCDDAYESATKIVAHANLLRERELRQLSHFWFSQAENLLGFSIPYGGVDSPFVHRFTDGNWILLNQAARDAGVKMRYFRCVSETRKRHSLPVRLCGKAIQSAKTFLGFKRKEVYGDRYLIDPDIPDRVDVKMIDIPRRLFPIFMNNKQVERIN